MLQIFQNDTPVKASYPHWLTWLPALCWLPIVLAVNSILLPPETAIAYWGRWIGLVTLVVYGFCKTFLPKRWRPNEFDKFALLVFLLIAISTLLVSKNSVLYAADFYETGMVKAFSFFLAYLALTWGVNSLLVSFASAVDIVKNLVIVATAIYTIGFFGNLTGLIGDSIGAPSGIFINRNTTAALGIVILPLSIWFASSQKQWKLFRFLPTFVIAASILISRSRSPLVVSSLLLLYYIVCWLRHKRIKMMRSLFAVLLILLSFLMFLSIDFQELPLIDEFYDSLTNPNLPGISSYRSNVIWPLFIEEISDSPLSIAIGNGWGSEEALLISKASQDYLFSQLKLPTAHNAYLGLTYQIGIIGCLLIFLPLWFLVFEQIKNSALYTNREQFEFRLALVGTLLAELCLGFFESGFYNIGSAHALPGWIATYIVVSIKYFDA